MTLSTSNGSVLVITFRFSAHTKACSQQTRSMPPFDATTQTESRYPGHLLDSLFNVADFAATAAHKKDGPVTGVDPMPLRKPSSVLYPTMSGNHLAKSARTVSDDLKERHSLTNSPLVPTRPHRCWLSDQYDVGW